MFYLKAKYDVIFHESKIYRKKVVSGWCVGHVTGLTDSEWWTGVWAL